MQKALNWILFIFHFCSTIHGTLSTVRGTRCTVHGTQHYRGTQIKYPNQPYLNESPFWSHLLWIAPTLITFPVQALSIVALCRLLWNANRIWHWSCTVCHSVTLCCLHPCQAFNLHSSVRTSTTNCTLAGPRKGHFC